MSLFASAEGLPPVDVQERVSGPVVRRAVPVVGHPVGEEVVVGLRLVGLLDGGDDFEQQLGVLGVGSDEEGVLLVAEPHGLEEAVLDLGQLVEDDGVVLDGVPLVGPEVEEDVGGGPLRHGPLALREGLVGRDADVGVEVVLELQRQGLVVALRETLLEDLLHGDPLLDGGGHLGLDVDARPALRGPGGGSQLVDHLLQEGREAGIPRVRDGGGYGREAVAHGSHGVAVSPRRGRGGRSRGRGGVSFPVGSEDERADLGQDFVALSGVFG